MLAVTVVLVAIAGVAHAQRSLSRDSLKGVEIGIRGCVQAGIDSSTVVLDEVLEVGRDGVARRPVPPGLPLAIYSLRDARPLLRYVGRTVDIRGRIREITDSEIRLKPGPQKDGSLIAEIKMPGQDVKATLDEVPLPVGTSGTDTAVKTVVLQMDIVSVHALGGCR
jgi:hypothetical protein